jgi:hypothetical protein
MPAHERKDGVRRAVTGDAVMGRKQERMAAYQAEDIELVGGNGR